MNRHIYGLTLFLVIIKTHFLLYWAFFAPINFYSTQDKIAVETLYKNAKYNLPDRNAIELQNVVIDMAQNAVIANVHFNELEDISNLSKFEARLHIYSNNLLPTTGLVEPAYIDRGNRTVTFKRFSPAYSELIQGENFYAEIEFFPYTFERPRKMFAPQIEHSTPVLIVGKKIKSCFR